MRVLSTMTLEVSDHALWRAAERFGSFGSDLIEAEVRQAIRAGRLSVECPPGIRPTLSTPITLFAWTESGMRVYPLRATNKALIVVTTLRRNGTGPG